MFWTYIGSDICCFRHMLGRTYVGSDVCWVGHMLGRIYVGSDICWVGHMSLNKLLLPVVRINYSRKCFILQDPLLNNLQQ
jgi:hypothetical protein